MGSTDEVSTLEERLYEFASKHLYPKAFQFQDEEIRIFKDAVKLGYVSDCKPLNQVDYDRYLDRTLREIRQEIGLEDDLILAYYGIEKRRYPRSKASQRLLD